MRHNQGQNQKRSRGRGRRNSNHGQTNFNRNTTFDSNGPDGRLRGNALQLYENTRHLRMMQTLLANGFLLKLWPSLLTTITAYIRQFFKRLINIAAIKKSVSSKTVSLRMLRQKRPKSQLMA